jgi:quercetin dioxygenase-like cupin family protein
MQLFRAEESLAPTDDGRYRRMVVQRTDVRAAFLGYAAGDEVHLHAHLESDELFHVLAGTPTFVVEGEEVTAHAGDLLLVAAGERHAIRMGDTPVALLAIVSPNRDDAWVAGA